jgi:hypothetical protein
MYNSQRLANILQAFVLFFIACATKIKNTATPTQQQLLNNLTNIIIHDVYAPPVSSRIYAYCNIAYYEGLHCTTNKSLIKYLHGFNKIQPIDTTNINPQLAATTAFYDVAYALLFSKDSVTKYQNTDIESFTNTTTKQLYNNSVNVGKQIAATVLQRATTDNYKLTRGMPRFTVFTSKTSWQQTPPDYADAIEPNWQKITPLFLDSATQFAPPPPPTYNEQKTSPFYTEMLAVYNQAKANKPEQEAIALFWDDNPIVTQHRGHTTFATKKATPVGHWMGITGILAKQKKLNAQQTALLFATTSIAIFDGFISCWAEKYTSKKIRPVTAIRNLVDDTWSPFLQTPPFPEYTSGHSVISNAAATCLQHYLGNAVAFTDSSAQKNLSISRSYATIQQAADEAGISRFYGGIHYTSAITAGKKQGTAIANFLLQKLPPNFN